MRGRGNRHPPARHPGIAQHLYSDTIAAFTEEFELTGEIIAQHAAVAMIGSAAETQFHTALASHDTIGQAKGILMRNNNITGPAVAEWPAEEGEVLVEFGGVGCGSASGADRPGAAADVRA